MSTLPYWGYWGFAGSKHLTGSYSFSAAESATYCLVKNAVKMFKDIGVSVYYLWYKRSLLFSFCLDLVYLSHLCVGVDPERSSFCWINRDHISGGGWGMLKVRPIWIDLLECSRIFLVFIFIPKLFIYNRCQCVSSCCYSLAGMLIMPYDFQLFSCFFTDIVRSILRYLLRSCIMWDMTSMEVLVVFVRDYL